MLDRLKQIADGESVATMGAYINGCWIGHDDKDLSAVENPATEAVIAHVPTGTQDVAADALDAAQKARLAWAAIPAPERGRLVGRLADEIFAHQDMLARIVVAEQGKPLTQAVGEIGATELFLRYAAESGRRIEGDIVPSDAVDEEIWIRRVPYGVVVGLTAWNYPSALAARKIGPAIPLC